MNSEPKPDQEKPQLFLIVMEIFGWLRIMISPLIIGLFIGATIYISGPTRIRLVLGIAVATLGLVAGIIWATRQLRGNGTIWFLSRIHAMPDLDKAIEENNAVKEGTRKDKAIR